MNRKTQIAVVGAGLGGLTVAGFLQRAGFAVTVYEQAPTFSRIGAGIILSANAMKVLRRLGVAYELIRTGIKPQCFVSRAWDTGATMYEIHFDDASEQRYGGPYLNIHRGDLHEILAKAVAPETIAFDHQLVDLKKSQDRYSLRFMNGETAQADIVIGVPDSATAAAIGYADEAGLPYIEGLIKNRYIGRTFISPDQSMRSQGVKLKFNPLVANLKGQRVVLVDDSIVRGTTTRQLVALLRRCGAREVHVRLTCPPMRTVGVNLLATGVFRPVSSWLFSGLPPPSGGRVGFSLPMAVTFPPIVRPTEALPAAGVVPEP